jgi:hypothetical integral membrane protein (TIGR02206 family)
VLYRAADHRFRRFLRFSVSFLILAGELVKTLLLLLWQRYTPEQLPLHLCSINMFLIGIHTLRPGKLLDNFLYSICLPGAAIALLAPGWASLPFSNFLCIHSFSLHILLMAYPIMLLAGNELSLSLRCLPRALALLFCLALLALGANLWLGTNFMFLMYAPAHNPLHLFETAFGSHLIGFPVIAGAVLALMYLPICLAKAK